MKLKPIIQALGLALATIGAAQAQISDNVVKIGVLTDLSGLYSDVAGKGTVQVHQMQAPRALVHPTAGHDRRVFAEGGGLVHIALFEAYAVAVFEVNRRN